MDSLINIGIYLTYIMISFGALAAVGFGIKKMISNNQNTKKTIYTVGGLASLTYEPTAPAVFDFHNKIHNISSFTTAKAFVNSFCR